MAANPPTKHSPPGGRVLKPRQLEIALLMADGLSAKEIAARLHLSPRTVDFHRREIRDTLGIKSTALLVRWLIREGLLEP
jgi:two-component system, LuxR family, secretion system response regulator SsrB